MFAEVSFPISSYQTFSYKVPKVLTKKITVGVRVKVPLGSRKVNGIVVGINNSSSFKGKIREIHDLIDDQQVLNDNLWSLIKWLSKYYNSPLGIAAKAVLPSNLSTKYKPKVEVKFSDMFPTSLSGLDYTQESTDVEYFKATASFRYLYYEFETVV